MVGAYAYGSVAVIEEFIEGTEVTVAVVDRGRGPIALPAVEIRPESGVYDYTARYTAGATRFCARLSWSPMWQTGALMWPCGCMRRSACGTSREPISSSPPMGSRSSWRSTCRPA